MAGEEGEGEGRTFGGGEDIVYYMSRGGGRGAIYKTREMLLKDARYWPGQKYVEFEFESGQWIYMYQAT